MSSANDVRAGKAYVELYMRRNAFTKGLKDSLGDLRKFNQQVMAIGAQAMKMGAAIGAIGGLLLAAFKSPVKAASDFAETVSKFGAVFGDNADEVRKWADEYRKQVGRAEGDTLNALATFQSFFLSLGIGADEARKMSKEMTQLSVDFGSFHNVTDPEAMQRFISALSGSGEVLSMYGVNIMEAALNQKLLAMGFPTIAKGATEVQKVMARMSIIRESMGKQGAVGDATKTAGSFSNQIKALGASISDVSIAIGNALIPALTPFVKMAADAGKVIAEWIKENQQVVVTIASVAAGMVAAGAALTAFGLTMTGIGAAITGTIAVAGTMATVLAGAFALLVNPITLAIGAVAAVTAAFVLFTDTGKAAFTSVSETIYSIFKPAIEFVSGVVASTGQAFASGNIAGAMKVAFAAGNVVLQEFLLAATNTFYGIKQAAIDLWNEISAQFSGGVAFIGSIMGQVSKFVTPIWTVMVAGVGAAMDAITGFGTVVGAGFKIMVNQVMTFVKALGNVVTGLDSVMSAFEKTGLNDPESLAGKQLYTNAKNAAAGLGVVVPAAAGAIVNPAMDARQQAIDAARARGAGASDANRAAWDAAAATRQEALDKANRDLEAAKAAVEKEKNKGADKSKAAIASAPAAIQAQMAASSQMGTFSAAGLIAGARGGPDKVQKDILEETKRGNKEVAKKIDKQIKVTEKLHQFQMVS